MATRVMNGHRRHTPECTLLGEKRTPIGRGEMSAPSQKGKFANQRRMPETL